MNLFWGRESQNVAPALPFEEIVTPLEELEYICKEMCPD
jgi:hypothetical protein